jgi:hypothetical protein
MKEVFGFIAAVSITNEAKTFIVKNTQNNTVHN